MAAIVQHPFDLKFSSDGKRMAIRGAEHYITGHENTIFIYDVDQDREITRFNIDRYLRTYTISWDGHFWIAVERGNLIVRDLETGRTQTRTILSSIFNRM